MGTISKERHVGAGYAEYELTPKGNYQAVLVDFVDCGWQNKVYDNKPKGLRPYVKLVFQINKTRDDGKPYIVFGKEVALSFDDRSNLYKDLSGVLGQEELDNLLESDEWDTDKLVGVNCRMQVIHETSKKGKVYDKWGAMFPWGDGDGDLLYSTDYVRRQDRDDWEEKKPRVSSFESHEVAVEILGDGLDGHEEEGDADGYGNGGESDPEPPRPMETTQKTLILREAVRIIGTDTQEALKAFLKVEGYRNSMTYQEAEQFITRMKAKPDFRVMDDELDIGLDDDDPFSDE